MVSMDWLVRHRQTEGVATDRLVPNDAGASSLLYLPVLPRYVGQTKKIERFRLFAFTRPFPAKSNQPGLRLVHA